MQAKTLRFAPVLLPLLLASCGGSEKPAAPLAYDPSLPPPVVAPADKSNQKQEADASLAVNKFLWRAALETFQFMPMLSEDPYGGVIVTDWYSPRGTQEERFKASVYILGRQLRSDGLKVVLFRQMRQGGAWADAAVAPETATDIENKVLARARELRAQGV